ncbi:hypothetical protein ACOMICROBIO_NCLOACGD_04527 [Vibrio sp. B1ASS3]|nr:hypothetical protein ACOMICROBIO_NCLOACGD_04527 [Vibrio sp. B1ASS3]CAE6953921.1 hypothetical protein ACOMICROBIO_NCLOACGD_04527 [Vibrio sp. B1ASS3]
MKITSVGGGISKAIKVAANCAMGDRQYLLFVKLPDRDESQLCDL